MHDNITKISIVIPIYNNPIVDLQRCFASVQNQTYQNFECIIVDDSDDLEVRQFCRVFALKNIKFRYFLNPKRLGLAASLNKGISLSSGDLIARIDGDDFCSVGRLEKQERFLRDNSEIGVLGSFAFVENAEATDVITFPVYHRDIVKAFLYINAVAHPSVMFRREVVNAMPVIYDENLRFAEDLDLWLRLLNAGVIFHNLNEPLITYRADGHGRGFENWTSNIKVRVKNLKSPMILIKVFFIILLVVFTALPARMRSRVYCFRRFLTGLV